MKKRICILTKSYKHGGFCVAGFDIYSKELIRLVGSSDPQNDQISKVKMAKIECFDVVDVIVDRYIPNFCQTENWLISNKDFDYVYKLSSDEVVNRLSVENDPFVILNNNIFLTEVECANLKKSLFVYVVKNVKIENYAEEYFGEIKYRNRCSFLYKDKEYKNISLTDPKYRDLYKNGVTIDYALVIVSLPSIPFANGLYYKFVAKIIEIDKLMYNILLNSSTIKSVSKDNKYDRYIEDGTKWSDLEDRMLVAFYLEGKSVDYISNKLNKNTQSVKNRLLKHRISKESRWRK